ncbi:MAG: hypothetical protein HY921_02090 [Elusimicrobia bacterium]|nr:hypothetical protein [Elusimicrobiota bacterium]
MNPLKYSDLRSKDKNYLIAQHDAFAKPDRVVPADFFLEEIYRRDREEHDQKLMQINRRMYCFTVIILICTVIQTFLATLLWIKSIKNGDAIHKTSQRSSVDNSAMGNAIG